MLEEPELNNEEIPEEPVPMGTTPMREPKAWELVAMAAQSMWRSLWRPDRGIPACVAKHPDYPIRAFGWHPYLAKFAIAPQDDTVRLYDMNAGAWSPLVLQHAFQTKIFALSWRPLSGRVLAVGTRHGVLIWQIVNKTVPNANQSRVVGGAQPAAIIAAQKLGSAVGGIESRYTNLTQAWRELGLEGGNVSSTNGTWASGSAPNKLQDLGAWCQAYHHFGHTPINTLEWSPSGRFLAAASANHSQLIVIDAVDQSVTPIVQHVAGNISKISWSPNDEFVCAVSATTNTFRVFHTQHWTSQKWSNLTQPLHSMCWSGDGSHLAFTVKGECKLYIARYTTSADASGDSGAHSSAGSSGDGVPPQVNGELVACLDLSPYVAKSKKRRSSTAEGDAEDEEYGGPLSFVAWDPTSSRLAVALEGTELIALYQCNALSYVVSFQPLGYLRGPPETAVSGLYFRPNFARGALLTATFSNGKISFFPLYFKPIVL